MSSFLGLEHFPPYSYIRYYTTLSFLFFWWDYFSRGLGWFGHLARTPTKLFGRRGSLTSRGQKCFWGFLLRNTNVEKSCELINWNRESKRSWSRFLRETKRLQLVRGRWWREILGSRGHCWSRKLSRRGAGVVLRKCWHLLSSLWCAGLHSGQCRLGSLGRLGQTQWCNPPDKWLHPLKFLRRQKTKWVTRKNAGCQWAAFPRPQIFWPCFRRNMPQIFVNYGWISWHFSALKFEGR